MIDKSFIKAIEENARKPRQIHLDGQPGDMVYVDSIDGSPPTWVSIPPPRRKYGASTLDGLIQQVQYMVEQARRMREHGQPEQTLCVFVDDTIRAVIAEEHGGLESISFPMEYSVQYKRLAEWHRRQTALAQSELVWVLRSELAGDILDEDFLPTIRQIRWSTREAGDSRVQHAQESLGASVELGAASLSTDGGLPETVRFGIPVYTMTSLRSGQRFAVNCAVRFDLQSKTIQIKPEPGALEQARCEAIESIAHMIRDQLETGTLQSGGRPEAVVFTSSTPQATPYATPD